MNHDVQFWPTSLTNLNDGVFCPKGSQKGLTQWRSARFLQSQIVHSSTLWGWLCGIIDWGCHWRNRARTPHDHSCLTASMLRHFEAVRQGKKTTGLEKFCLFVLFLSGQTLALQVLTIGASASFVQNGTCHGTIWDPFFAWWLVDILQFHDTKSHFSGERGFSTWNCNNSLPGILFLYIHSGNLTELAGK